MTKLIPIDTLVIKAGTVRYDGEAGCMEALRQAIIRDFVKSREPRAYTVRLSNSATDVLNWEIPDKNWRELGCKAQHYAPLYELPIISEWKAK